MLLFFEEIIRRWRCHHKWKVRRIGKRGIYKQCKKCGKKTNRNIWKR